MFGTGALLDDFDHFILPAESVIIVMQRRR